MSTDALKRVFSSTLDVPEETIGDDLAFGVSPAWDSVAHMALIAAIEREFNILISTDDVIDMSSFGKAREILGKYGVPE
jgi:acyl carrier protein